MAKLTAVPTALLFALVACSSRSTEPTQGPATGGASVTQRVEVIEAGVKSIDALVDSPSSGKVSRRQKELPHWQVSGLFEGEEPIFLSALFSEGQVEREEKYYLTGRKLILVRTEKWWDVEDGKREPEPRTRQDFYIENAQTIRNVVNVASSPPESRTSDTAKPATRLIERSRSIGQLLSGGIPDAAMRALDEFPETDASKP